MHNNKCGRILSLFLVICLLIPLFPVESVTAAEISGVCGNNATWSFDAVTGTLTISGSGEMMWYPLEDDVNAAPWEMYQDSITTVTIDRGITSIGECAFAYCKNLTDVSIPDTVQAIGAHAFRGCESLTEVVIPDSVTSIGRLAFCSCTSLTSVTLSKNITMIDEMVFRDCRSLASVSIPEGVTSIGAWAFDDCMSLTELHIPDGVKTIGMYAFDFCSSLSQVVIPDSVTSIGEKAFYVYLPQYANQDLNVYFMGDAPSIVPISDDFYSYESFPETITTLYYIPGMTGWTDSTAYDATAGTWNGYTLKVWEEMLSQGPKVDVPAGEYCIHVVDENGAPISGALVGWEDSTDPLADTTDENGNAFFPLATIGTPVIEVKKSGYLSWTNRDSNWEKSENRYETVILYPEGLGEYKLLNARYSNFKSMKLSTNVLTGTKKLSLGNDLPAAGDLDFGIFYLSCKACRPDNVVSYELWQGENKIADCRDGFFSALSTEHFQQGGECFVRVISQDGQSVDTAINLVFVKTPINKATSLDISADAVSFKIGDNVPFVGGSTFNMKLPIKLPITTRFGTDNKMMFGFNLKLDGEDDEETFKSAKKLLNDAKKSAKRNLTKQQAKLFKSLTKNPFDFSMFDSGELNLIGYAEADLGSSIATGHIMFEAKLDIASMDFNAVVVVVPVTVQVGLSAGADATAEISYDWANATLLGTLDFGLNGKLKAFGGVGVGKAIGVGTYGSAELDVKTRLLGTPKGLQSVDLTGELGLKAYFACFEYERAFAYNTWHLYTVPELQSVYGQISLASEVPNELDAAQYHLSDLSYLSSETQWQCEPVSLFDERASNSMGMEFSPLLEDTYRNAQPVMATSGNALYAAFLRADPESGDIYLAVTKFNGTSWANPVRVDESAVLDGAPSICVAADGTILLSYTHTNETYDRSSLLGFAKNQTVVVGSIDANTLRFTKLAEYSAEGYARKACLSNVNGIVALSWLDSTVTDDNSVLFPVRSTIFRSEYAKGRFGEKEELVAVDKPVLSIVTGDTTAYVVDEDGNQATAEDHALYSVADGLLVDGLSGHVSYGQLPGDDSAGFIWNDEVGLKSTTGTSVAVDGVTNEYTVLNDTIYYSAAGIGNANLMMIKYNNGNWTPAIQLTDNDRYFENINVLRLFGSDYVLGMYTAATISELAVTDAKNLVWAKVAPVYDIALIDVTYDEDALAIGKEVALTLHVTNNGESAVTSVDVGIDGNYFRADGFVLQPGDTIELSAAVICTDTLKRHEIYVYDTANRDRNYEDNRYEIEIGHADIVVETECQQIGDQHQLVVYVTNRGIAPASGSLRLYEGDKIVGSGKYENVESASTTVLSYALSDVFTNYRDFDITVVAESTSDEKYTYNNTSVIHIGEIISNVKVCTANFDGKTVYADIVCPEETAIQAVFAAFNEAGKMMEVKERKLNGGMNEIALSFEQSGMVTCKLMIVDQNYIPFTEAATLRE